MLSVRAAQHRILRHIHPLETEQVLLDDCAGRVLAADVRATDLPRFDNSSVDGFAVLASDLSGARRDRPRTLRVVGDIPAGSNKRIVLTHGQAARIMTGALLPPSADAVIMIEDTDLGRQPVVAEPPQWLRAFKAVSSGENIRRRGTDVLHGRKILRSGHRLRPQDLGMLAMLGRNSVPVVRRPRVALLSSGDELVPLKTPLTRGKIRDSNSYALKALAVEMGCEVLGMGIAPDNRKAIQRRLDRAVGLSADLIISSAGVSVGAMDLLRDVIQSRGKMDFWRVNVRPGKPLAVGRYRGVPIIGLPGNPVSAFIGFELFVRPALLRFSGIEAERRRTVKARIAHALESDGRESYLRSIVEDREGVLHVKLTGHQGSGNLLSLVQANALLIIPAGVKSLAVGDWADVWLL